MLPATLPIGAYQFGTDTVYVAPDGEPPDRPSLEYFDAATGMVGDLTLVSGDRYRTEGTPVLVFRLSHPAAKISERRFLIHDAGGAFGFSLWSSPSIRPLGTIILIQGADDSTRDYGFLTPFFVNHGLNVVTYAQRGTGSSTGNWRSPSPEAKAADVLGMIDAIKSDATVDPHRIGVWAASNGGWVAPIVATKYPLAFMILKSAPAESIVDNILYEIKQSLRENGRFTPQQIASAMSFERTMFHSLKSNADWGIARSALAAAKKQPWFKYMRIPPGMTAPPPPRILAVLQASLLYDPSAILTRVTVPTLALFGARDKNVDAQDSIRRFRRAFRKAGMTDFSACVFPTTGHLLVQSRTGYVDRSDLPVRYTGYPEAMIGWLRERGFARSKSMAGCPH